MWEEGELSTLSRSPGSRGRSPLGRSRRSNRGGAQNVSELFLHKGPYLLVQILLPLQREAWRRDLLGHLGRQHLFRLWNEDELLPFVLQIVLVHHSTGPGFLESEEWTWSTIYYQSKGTDWPEVMHLLDAGESSSMRCQELLPIIIGDNASAILQTDQLCHVARSAPVHNTGHALQRWDNWAPKLLL